LLRQVILQDNDFDTLLAAYTGSSVGALALVARNDNCITGESTASCLNFTVKPGTVYSLQVDGARGAKGIFRVVVAYVWDLPSNDAFSAAVATFPASGTTVGAALEVGEPAAGSGASASVWYRYNTTPESTTKATVGDASCMAQFACNKLQLKACNLLQGIAHCLRFHVCHVSRRSRNLPDAQYSSLSRSSHIVRILTTFTSSRTMQPMCRLLSGQVTLAGSNFNTLLAVYTGTAVNSLTLVSSNDDCEPGVLTSCTTFSVVPGTSYSIQVDGHGAQSGDVSIAVTPAPLNDAFVAAVSTFPALGTTVGATLETGEPSAGPGASGSVWFRYTPPASTSLVTVSEHGEGVQHGAIDCGLQAEHPQFSLLQHRSVSCDSRLCAGQVTLAGSSFDTLLAVYTGTTVNTLTLVSSNDDCPSKSRVLTSCTTFSVVPGTSYSIQVDGYGAQSGDVSIAVILARAAPLNDAFVAAVSTFPAKGTTVGATLETGEPSAGPGASGSVWFRYTPPASTSLVTVSDHDEGVQAVQHGAIDCRLKLLLNTVSEHPQLFSHHAIRILRLPSLCWSGDTRWQQLQHAAGCVHGYRC
jgi:hypothetical protein